MSDNASLPDPTLTGWVDAITYQHASCACTDAVFALARVLRSVLVLHTPVTAADGDRQFCFACGDPGPYVVAWPCTTVKAMEIARQQWEALVAAEEETEED
jgi:hypothetical protein